MNRPPPPGFPSPHFIFNPPNPNPNPSFNPPNPNPNRDLNSVPSHAQLKSPDSDVVGTLSALDELLRFSESTFDRFESIVPGILGSERARNELARCGSNPNHLMPAKDLFLHSLRCPSGVDVKERELLEELRYPKTLRSEDELMRENKFVQKLEDPNAELCFSLDEYMDFDTNFFYKDCPGVVSLSGGDSKDRMFSLPGVLAVECVNFCGESCGQIDGFSKGCVMLLPSEVWAVRCEVERWSDCPCFYSYSVLKLFMGLEFVKRIDSLTWITTSSRFGIVIDVAMGDHIFVLFCLCLKAAMREAARISEVVLRADDNSTSNGTTVKGDACFKCPVLVDAFRWLRSQLSILYGEGGAHSLIIVMLKNLLLNVASNLSLWHVDQCLVDASASKLEEAQLGASPVSDHISKVAEDNGDVRADAGICSRPVFVYQVGAAIASLYERSLLEEKIRTVRNPRRLAAYERANEHACWSTIAEEERKKRPNYRPLLEHDGLPSPRPNDQGTSGKTRTREELLAEERDYKRRRMSYRGKKLKRTTKEVLRDIIEEHMESIREAGGIGFSVKGEGKIAASEPFAGHGFSGGAGLRPDTSKAYETRLDQWHGHDKQLSSDYDVQRKERTDAYSDRSYERRKDDSHKHEEGHDGRRTIKREGYHRKYASSRSPDTGRSNETHREEKSYSRGFSKEGSYRRDHDSDEVVDERHYWREYLSSTTSEHLGRRHRSSMSRSGSISSRRRDGIGFDASDKHRRKRHENDGSGSLTRDDFSDRYDPSRLRDADDELLSDSKYVRPVSPFMH